MPWGPPPRQKPPLSACPSPNQLGLFRPTYHDPVECEQYIVEIFGTAQLCSFAFSSQYPKAASLRRSTDGPSMQYHKDRAAFMPNDRYICVRASRCSILAAHWRPCFHTRPFAKNKHFAIEDEQRARICSTNGGSSGFNLQYSFRFGMSGHTSCLCFGRTRRIDHPPTLLNGTPRYGPSNRLADNPTGQGRPSHTSGGYARR